MESPDDSSPLITRVVGLLCIAIGAWSGVHMIFALLQGSLWIDFTVLGIWFGRGLLLRKRMDRIFIMGMALIGLLATVFMTLAAWKKGFFSSLDVDEQWLAAAAVSGYVILYGFILAALRTQTTRLWFQNPEIKDKAGQDATRWTWAMVIVGVFLACSTEVKDWAAKHTSESTYALHTTFRGVDSSGEPLDLSGIGPRLPESEFYFGTRRPSHPQVSTKYAAHGNDGKVEITASTVLVKPLTLELRSEGMKPVIYTVDSQTPSEVTITFERDGTAEKDSH